MSLYSAVHKFIEDVKKDDDILERVDSDSDAMLLVLKAWLIGRVLPDTLKESFDEAETPRRMESLRGELSWSQNSAAAQEERANTLAASAKMLKDFNDNRFNRLKEKEYAQAETEAKLRAELRKMRKRIKLLVAEVKSSKDS